MDIHFSKNNLDWLRLLFASQVMVVHVFSNLQGPGFEFLKFVNHFPGVPSFFFVSGFLIYASYERNSTLMGFAKNRALRIWPGLIFVTIAGLVMVVIAHFEMSRLVHETPTYILWFFSQVTLGQAWNPSVFRDVGNGVVNGALWTITVDVLFYCCVPVIVFLEKFVKHIVVVFAVLSFGFYSFGEQFMNFDLASGKSAYEYLSITPIVWGWMFLTGTLVYKNINTLKKYIPHLYLSIVPIILLITLDIPNSIWFTASYNNLGLVYFWLLCSLVMFVGFKLPYIKLTIDLSYGVYIWHMVIINFFLVLGFHSWPLALALTYFAATISWYFVEKPFLAKKQISLRMQQSR